MAKCSGMVQTATTDIFENNNVTKYLKVVSTDGKTINYLSLSNIKSIDNKEDDEDIEDTERYNYDYSAKLDLTGDTLYFKKTSELIESKTHVGLKLIKSKTITYYRKYISSYILKSKDYITVPDYVTEFNDEVYWDLCDPEDQTGNSTDGTDTTGSNTSTALNTVASVLAEIKTSLDAIALNIKSSK